MQRNSVWRAQDFNHTVPIESIHDFPGGTAIHLLDSLNDTIPTYLPKNNPFLFLGKNRKYIRHILNFQSSETDIIELPDKGIYLPVVQWQRPVNEFSQTTGSIVRPIPNGANDPVISNTTEYFLNYNFMFRAITRSSILPTLRKFDYIFSGVLNKIMQHQVLDHFITIPMPTDISVIFKRNDFDRTFTKIDRSTIKYPDFPHYLFFMYLLNFVHNGSDLGPLNSIPKNMLSKINFIVYNNTDFVIYNLEALHNLNSGIKAADDETEDTDDRHIEPNRVLYKMIDQFNKLSRVETEENTVKLIDDKLITVNKKPDEYNAPSVKNIISNHVNGAEIAEQRHTELTKIIEEHVIEKAIAHIDNNDNLSERQKTKALSNAVAYKNIVLGGKTATEILHQADNSIDDVYLDPIKDHVADKSMLSSKVINFDNSYMSKTFRQDLLGTLTFYNRIGMFLVDLKEEDVSDELNQSTLYIAKWVDSTNTPHPPMRFLIPNVDKDGRCFQNGVYRAMKKQRVNLPICKVSPNRVTMTSSFNKCIIERAITANTQFYPFFTSILLPGHPEIALGNADVSATVKLPYEYSVISRKMLRIELAQNIFIFDYTNRFKEVPVAHAETITALEKRYGVYCGFREHSTIHFFMDFKCRFIEVDVAISKPVAVTTLSAKVAHINKISNGKLNEFIQMKILSRNIPLGFVLCYKFGLSYILKYLHTNYKVYTKREQFTTKIDDISIEFKDCTLVIPRAPILNSSILGGLAVYNTKKYNMEQFDSPDVYFDIMMYKGYANYLKGVDSFFDLFVGYVEFKVLKQMNEPTELKDLLIRAAVMLTTPEHKGASSSTQFKIRSYEKYIHIINNEIARAYSTWKHKSLGHTQKFSINPYAIQQRINEDGGFDKLDVINPIHQIKMKTAFTHLGEGGRTADTFMIADRKFDDDSVGILSTSTVDNSSVGINGSLTINPNILNTGGLALPKDIEDVTPTEMLCVTSLLFPSLCQDSGQRNNFVNIQSSQFVPLEHDSPIRVRTGFERAIAHMAGKPFATVAQKDGTVSEINEELQIVKVTYTDGEEEFISYAKEFSNNSGHGFYVPQNLKLNNFKAGDKITKGDVIVYNRDFFEPNRHNKQVDMKIGIPTTVAFIESDKNFEDASAVSQTFAERLKMNVGHVITVLVTKDTQIYECVNVGDHVLSTDVLMTFDQNPLTDDETEKHSNDGLIDVLNAVSRTKPKAKYTGRIADIHAFYKCPLSEMSPSMSSFIKKCTSTRNKKYRYTKDSFHFPESKPLLNEKVGSVLLTDETIVIRFTLEQDYGVGDGDKIFVGSANKSIISKVLQAKIMSESGVEIDLIHSGKGVNGRTVNSPYLVGVTSRVMKAAQEKLVKMYFG